MDHYPSPVKAFNEVQRKQITISFAWLILAGAIGIVLRWHFISPIADFPFAWWRHAHSHLAFLGWIGNVFISLLLFDQSRPRWLERLWWFSQLLLIGMSISFPLGGYSGWSIVFSTIHILCCWLFATWWFVVGRKGVAALQQTAGDWAFALLSISQLGPVGLGLSMALAPEQRQWYEFFLHFYLYFQHSGWFILGIIAISLKYGMAQPNTKKWQQFITWTGYYSIIYFTASQGQILKSGLPLALALLSLATAFQLLRIFPIWPVKRNLQPLNNSAWVLWKLAIVCWILKIVMEQAFLIPGIQDFTENNRFFQLGFLHLNFLGIVCPLLFVLFIHQHKAHITKWPVALYLLGTLLTLLLLFANGLPNFWLPFSIEFGYLLLFVASLLLWLAKLSFYALFLKKV